ncbi:hypothetical protein [Bacillus sp. ISL-46]|uniref:hypothetical protein n=1 Tax=Bacillus sp. ISL-46 TaxID=2819129 RepID=UPI001BEB3548|nr:hypothetical protein [Bacillus sp. ISL-46]
MLTNQAAEDTFYYLKTAPVMVKAIVFALHGLPVVTGFAKDLEIRCANTSFPMNNKTNRQIVGRMLCYLLKNYGFSPKNVPESAKHLRQFSEASYFKTSQVYEKTHNPSLQERDVVIQLLEQMEEQQNQLSSSTIFQRKQYTKKLVLNRDCDFKIEQILNKTDVEK